MLRGQGSEAKNRQINDRALRPRTHHPMQTLNFALRWTRIGALPMDAIPGPVKIDTQCLDIGNSYFAIPWYNDRLFLAAFGSACEYCLGGLGVGIAAHKAFRRPRLHRTPHARTTKLIPQKHQLETLNPEIADAQKLARHPSHFCWGRRAQSSSQRDQAGSAALRAQS